MMKTAIILAILLLFISCAPAHHPRVSEPVTIALDSLRVHIVPTWKSFPAAVQRENVQGVAWKNDIYVIGHMVDGKIVIDWKVVGHELTHLLRVKKPLLIGNPDEYRQ